jgi:hypothetical protein
MPVRLGISRGTPQVALEVLDDLLFIGGGVIAVGGGWWLRLLGP